MFVGSIFLNPHETSLVLLGMPKGLKGLLHMLNAIMFTTTMEIECFALSFFLFLVLYCYGISNM
jgi:hypothetical protein